MIAERIFKAYDIRGIYPDELSEDAAYRIAQAYAKVVGAKTVVLGRDVRASGPALWEAVARGLNDHGVSVVDIGVITTDMLYFATGTLDCDGGITVSASHNPAAYNGLKLMRRGAVAISGDTGIEEMKRLVLADYAYRAPTPGGRSAQDIRADYLAKCLSFIDPSELREVSVVANAMFGPVGENLKELALPVRWTWLNEVPDGSFPKGPPDPLLEENRAETIALIRKTKPDLGVAWDGDADRFFLFDETGRFVPGYYLTAFLGAYFAKKYPGAKIIHDPRLTWATEDAVRAAGGAPIMNRAGHSFIKQRMRAEDAVFAGEMSGHFYFRDYFYADNGLIPFLTILEIVAASGRKVSELFAPFFARYFISGELNYRLPAGVGVPEVLRRVEERYRDATLDHTDGVSLAYDEWRANVRGSNTEPLVRLNVEAKREALVPEKTKELEALIGGTRAN